jgi:hypothetical protein
MAITVTNLNDSGAGSLRQAILDASPGEAISIAVSGTITLASELAIDKALAIRGLGAGALTISGGGASRVFNVDTAGSNQQIRISDLTIANGSTGGLGGGVLLGDENLTLDHVVIRNNTGANGGGISANAGSTLQINNSTVHNNTSTGVGGGGLIVFGTATVSNSTITANTAPINGGGINVQPAGNLTLSSSTVAANTSGGQGGGVSNLGAITANNSIIADNTGPGGNDTATGNNNFVVNYSLVEDPDLGTPLVTGPGYITGVDPGLGPLTNNGGPVPTMLPSQTGPAFNAGNSALATGFDARGLPRVSGAAIDLGAVELQIAVAAPVGNPGNDDEGRIDYGPAIMAEFTNVMRYFETMPARPSTVTTPTGQTLPDPFAAPLAGVQAIIAQVNQKTLPPEAALERIIDMADATTSVATLNYQFFTGRTPSQTGLDYLISSPANPADLNDGYYAAMTPENRFINFAVNLGRDGEGRTAFQAAYGALSLADATSKAYAEIFGSAPAAGKVADILGASVAFAGHSGTRADYLTALGGDGLGAKAAMVGFLLAEAAKSDIGAYAAMNEAFLTDIADGVGAFGADAHIYLATGITLIGLG